MKVSSIEKMIDHMQGGIVSLNYSKSSSEIVSRIQMMVPFNDDPYGSGEERKLMSL